MAAVRLRTKTAKRDGAVGRGRGRSLAAKVFPARHQRVETLLQRDDLEGHVTGGQDEDADAARGHKRSSGSVNNPPGYKSNCRPWSRCRRSRLSRNERRLTQTGR